MKHDYGHLLNNNNNNNNDKVDLYTTLKSIKTVGATA